MTFWANPHFILQISHAKPFEMKYTRYPYNNVIQNIHKLTKTDYVWFEFLWIRRYLDLEALEAKPSLSQDLLKAS